MNEKLIEEKFKDIIVDGLGLDLNEPNLKDTPKRIARMYVNEIFSGLDNNNEPKMTLFPNDDNTSSIVQLDTMKFSSTCSHHFVPFSGHAWALYIPDKHIIGASKFSRVINYFADRPQTQERMTKQIAEYVMKVAKPKGFMIFTRAAHQCMICRGIKQNNTSGMSCNEVRGAFAEDSTLEMKGLMMIDMSLKMR